MRFTARTWAILSVILFTGGFYSWYHGNELQARRKALRGQEAEPASNAVPGGILTNLLSTAALTAPTSAAPKKVSLRVANTKESVRALSVSDKAILLRNALIDTSTGTSPEIPAHLRTEGEASSYVVQAKGTVGPAFRQALRDHGAELVSYIPNNAYLVRVAPSQVEELKQDSTVGAVMVFEPYYKLAGKLLKQAVDETPIAPDSVYRLTLFPGQEAAARAWFENQGGQVLAVDASPFGPQIVVRPPSVSLSALARLDSVQWVEAQTHRISANDLTRVFLGVSADQTNKTNFLGLTGDKVVVNVNDFGFDTNYPALLGRLLPGVPNLPTDTDGHGTFVATTLAGDGAGSDTVTNLLGSSTNGINLSGVASKSKLLALPLTDQTNVNDFVTDTWLQHTAAATNYTVMAHKGPMISNNSWVYENASEYDSAAARYDLAVRDSLPEVNGPQGMVFLFPAGNNGDGNTSGLGGESDSIRSPATAKNVITVGALEQLRYITNSFTTTNVVTDDLSGETFTNVFTNAPLVEISDSSTEVAFFSSRGNVGIGVEGDFGRFKPDVVAPGTVIVSGRSKDYKLENQYDTNSALYQVLTNIDKGLGQYRMDSGTSFAVPGVSGLLALLQEFFEHTLPAPLQRNLSPALTKALLINSSRSVNALYSLEPRGTVNYQGWGAPGIGRILSSNLLTLAETAWPLQMVEQGASNALATGQSRTWNVTLSEEASHSPLRFTLVWTDPPGNPGASIKLVNDLDLIVTNVSDNVDLQAVFIGNDMVNSGDFVVGRPFSSSLDETIFDNVNNVENVFIRDPSLYGTNFTVTVRARRVNVNAIGDYFGATLVDALRTNDVVQDFALVMSTDLNLATNAFTITQAVPFPGVRQTQFPPTTMTNGLPLFDQRAGANATLVGTNGITNQWHFFVFTNQFIPNGITDITNGSNVAFAIFNPPNLSTPRVVDADLDLYVSKDIRLFTLNPAFMASALVDRSVERGGEELITYTNATKDDIFYVAVKSEDQKAGEFSILSISSDTPFERPGPNGSRILTGLPAGAVIPDGSGYRPRAGIVLAVGISNFRARRVVVTNDITHELLGDLVGVLRHNRQSVILNNHTLNDGLFEGFIPLVYNDSGVTNGIPFSTLTDGPGSLRNFLGARMNGSWILSEIDNQPTHTGRVTQLSIRVDPLPDSLKHGVVVSGVLGPLADICYPIDVPAGVTNLILRLTQKDPSALPLEMYIKRGDIPTVDVNDGVATNVAGGGFELQVGLGSTPPISAGTWYVCIRNPNAGGGDIHYDLLTLFEYGVEADTKFIAETPGFALTDGAVSTGSLFEPRDVVIAGARVGLRIDHPRVSDLSVHLVSPQGTRLLLFENRGGTNGQGMGSEFKDSLGANVFSYFTFSDEEFVTTPVKFQRPPFADAGTNRGQVFFDGFETVTNGTYTTGKTFNGWEVITNEVEVVGDRLTAATGTNSLSLGTGAFKRTLPTVAGRAYQLRFKYELAPVLPLFSTGKNATNGNLAAAQTDQHYHLIRSDDPAIPLSTPVVAGAASYWVPDDANSKWVTPSGYSTRAAKAGVYTYRTSFSITNDPVNARITGFWASDNRGLDIFLNGKSTATPGSVHTAFNAPVLITTNLVKGLNFLDLVTTNAGAPTGVRAEFHLQTRSSVVSGFSNVIYTFPVGSPGSAPGLFAVELEGSLTNNYVSASGYRTASIDFIASADDQVLTFASLLNGSAQLDDIELVDTGSIFVKPEEPFDALNGQRAKGMWRLEVEDFRTTAPLAAASVVSWKLELDVASPFPPSETSRSGVTFPTTLLNTTLTNFPASFTPGRVANNDVQYFFVPYCANSTDLQVTLVASNNFGEVVLYADHSGFPTGNLLTDDYVPLLNNQNSPSVNGSATLHVTKFRPYGAPLSATEPFLFVGVANLYSDSTNYFTLRADFNGTCRLPFSFLVTPGNTNTLLVSSAAAAGVGGQQQLGFNVDDGATTATLSLTPSDQGHVSVTVQGPPTWDGSQPYAAQFVALGGVPSVLTLSQADSGHPIAPGLYQVTVDNLENTAGTLDVSFQQGEVIGGVGALQLNSPQTITVAANRQIQRDVTVSSDPSRLLFEVAGRPAGVDLVVRRQEDGLTLTSHNGAPLIWTALNAAGSLNGIYRVTVINTTGSQLLVTLLAGQPNGSGILVSVDPLRVGIGADQSALTFLSIAGEKYSLESSADLNEWEPVNSVTATSDQTTVPLPASQLAAQFYRLRQVPLQ